MRSPSTTRPYPQIEEALRLTKTDARHQLGACVVDATSVDGLRGLVRAYPTHWPKLMHKWVPGKVTLQRGMTLREVLCAGVLIGTMPRHAEAAETIRRDRASARRILEVLGDRAVAQVTLEDARALRERLSKVPRDATGRPLGAATLARAEQTLRRVVRWAQDALKLPTTLPARGPRRRTPGHRRERLAATGQDVARALERLQSPRDRARVALAAGAGLREADMDRLRRRDVHANGRLWVPTRRREIGRWVFLPAWAQSNLSTWLKTRPADDEGRVFPRGRSSRKALRRAAQDGRLGFLCLRRLHQGLASDAGAARGVVRGSLLDRPDARTWQTAYALPVLIALASTWSSPAGARPVRLISLRSRVPALDPENRRGFIPAHPYRVESGPQARSGKAHPSRGMGQASQINRPAPTREAKSARSANQPPPKATPQPSSGYADAARAPSPNPPAKTQARAPQAKSSARAQPPPPPRPAPNSEFAPVDLLSPRRKG